MGTRPQDSWDGPVGTVTAMLIGTSGWQYRHWRGGLYPSGLPVSRWLGHYSERFATVEINNAFYRLPELSGFKAWAEAVADDFVFAVKASRYLTHVRRLQGPEEPVQRLVERASGLGAKLGPVLLQLPPDLGADLDALDRACAASPGRSGSRSSSATTAGGHPVPGTCSRAMAPPCAWPTGTGGARPSGGQRTGVICDCTGGGRPPSCYGRAALQTWADELAELWPAPADLFVYFNNDQNGCAPHDARWLAAAARRAGLAPSRAPAASETPLR